MADAKKCDICGSLYELKKETPINAILTAYVTDGWKVKDFYDTCPECLSAIMDVIEKRKTK